MADTSIKYVSLDNLTLYDSLLKDYISVEDAKSLKTVTLSSDGGSLLFYRTSEPIAEGATPAYSIELPKTDLSSYMQKVISALSGDVAVFDANGSVVDGGVKLSDLITKTDVEELIAEKISQASHLEKKIVTELPSDADAEENVIYLIKIEGIESGDAYEEWTLIGGTLTQIGDTTTDLSDYYTKSEIDAKETALETKISDAIDTAAADATTKANAALADAKTYTDQEVAAVSADVTTLTNTVSTNTTDISTLQSTVSKHDDRITALESGISEMQTATEEDIKALFA